jgi:hypothetical protein
MMPADTMASALKEHFTYFIAGPTAAALAFSAQAQQHVCSMQSATSTAAITVVVCITVFYYTVFYPLLTVLH